MTDISKLRELLERVESATGPSVELDRDIYEFVIKGRSERVEWDVVAGDYTRSIDAAVALCERVLPGWKWSVRTCSGGPTGSVHHPSETPNVWNKTKAGRGETPALAFCAAILRAKIAMLEKAAA